MSTWLSLISFKRKGTISSLVFTSIKSSLLIGRSLNTSFSSGILSFFQDAPNQLPQSNFFNSLRVVSPITFSVPVVRRVLLSWWQTIWLSAVSLISISIPSAFWKKPSFIDAIVFSGASSDAPRWAIILVFSPRLEHHQSGIQ